jgi:ABC-type multidrug transport system permease subunit
MIRIFDITLKDLLQLVRDYKTFMFLLAMPIAFTLLFGYAFGGFSRDVSDDRLPLGYLDEDHTWLSRELHSLLVRSEVVRLAEDGTRSRAELARLVADGKLSAAVIVPHGYGQAVGGDDAVRLTLIADTGTPAGITIEAEILSAANRLDGAVRTAAIVSDVAGDRAPFDYSFDQTLAAWDDPPIAVTELTSTAVKKSSNQAEALAHTSPGMMLQFSIAGLVTAAQVIVAERKSRALQRLLTTSARRLHILLGHYVAIFVMILAQFCLLIAFGQVLLKVDYLRAPVAILLVAVSAALCIAGLGLLIGILAKSEEQAATFSIIPMFVLSGLGGAWVPLEVTGPTFQVIGHFTPLAWAMDGLENIVLRGLGFQSVLIPAAALLGYAALFVGLAGWRLQVSQES